MAKSKLPSLGRVSSRCCHLCAPQRRSILSLQSVLHIKILQVCQGRRQLSNSSRPYQAPHISSGKKQSGPANGHKGYAASSDLARAFEATKELLSRSTIPSDLDTLSVLQAIHRCALETTGLKDNAAEEPHDLAQEDTSTSAILSLDGSSRQSLAPLGRRNRQSMDGRTLKTQDLLSSLSYQIASHPSVFITQAILLQYVRIQSLLSRPATYPEVFRLYTSKPSPTAGKSSLTLPRLSTWKPFQVINSVSSAIPPHVANIALIAALRTRSLSLAISIILNSFCAPAFRRNKIFRRALLPGIGVLLMPVAAYRVASNVALYQTGLPAESFTTIVCGGLLTYAACVGTIGWVAIATANDQMRRVTWAEGTPLWERWVREEERAAIDRVACAWGLKETWRWGEEEGEDWEHLREWIGSRGLVLDNVSLMEGME